MAFEYIIYEKRDRVAYVTIDRPEVMNALHRGANEELECAFDDFRDDDECWIAIVTGSGDRAFCAGNDLKATADEHRNGSPADVGRRPRFGGITSNYRCDKPIIAAVNGVAVGGGFEIALACDIIVAAEHARFGLPEPRVGLVAGAGGIHRLPRQTGLKSAMGMLLTGRLIGAREAYRLGLVNEVVAGEELERTAERWAAEILECAPLSVRLTKAGTLDGLEGMPTVDDAIARDRPRIDRLLRSEDFLEGPRAFAEKRKPAWKGR